MAPLLMWASILITVAALIYTTAFVQSLRKKFPQPFYLIPFGYIFDFIGTFLMYLIVDKITWNIHTFLGIPGFILMFVTTVLGITILIRIKRRLERKKWAIWFRWFEYSAWAIWMASYVLGVYRHLI